MADSDQTPKLQLQINFALIFHDFLYVQFCFPKDPKSIDGSSQSFQGGNALGSGSDGCNLGVLQGRLGVLGRPGVSCCAEAQGAQG